jgi:hypothetical protein
MDRHIILEKDKAYWERNQLIAYLSKIFDSWTEKHPSQDVEWESEWRNIIFISFPEGLFSWHIHDSEMIYFSHLKVKEGNSWDGSSTEEKYKSLERRI